jgi:crossover junction endodeoxyribonuclease RuvC
MIRLIGIDPGSYSTGYGIIEIERDTIRLVEKGVIKISNTVDRYKRIAMLYEKITDVIAQSKPEFAAVEDSFYHKNAKTALLLGQIKGIIILALQKNNCKIYEFSPLEIKKAVVGYGQATKEQVEIMIKCLLKLNKDKIPHDCSDAIAAALCLSNSIQLLKAGVPVVRKL